MRRPWRDGARGSRGPRDPPATPRRVRRSAVGAVRWGPRYMSRRCSGTESGDSGDAGEVLRPNAETATRVVIATDSCIGQRGVDPQKGGLTTHHCACPPKLFIAIVVRVGHEACIRNRFSNRVANPEAGVTEMDANSAPQAHVRHVLGVVFAIGWVEFADCERSRAPPCQRIGWRGLRELCEVGQLLPRSDGLKPSPRAVAPRRYSRSKIHRSSGLPRQQERRAVWRGRVEGGCAEA
jgi:hypothetical protein